MLVNVAILQAQAFRSELVGAARFDTRVLASRAVDTVIERFPDDLQIPLVRLRADVVRQVMDALKKD